MKHTILGKTGLKVSRVAFGALPIQRISTDAAGRILRKAYENGINFFDTARAYSDSEEKMGKALSDVREKLVIATKTHAKDAKTLREHLETSLEKLKTSYIDIYQFHNPKDIHSETFMVMMEEAKKAKEEGLIRFISITNHTADIAKDAIKSGMYDTLQYPFSSISSEDDYEITLMCKEHNMGFIAMKALSGGLLTDAESAFAFLWQYDHVVPIWGIQREEELDQFIALSKNPPEFDDKMKHRIENDRKELAGSFCRSCGYCLPCPVGIDIPQAARMKFLLRRAPYQQYMSDEWIEKMNKIKECIECNKCKGRCPYHLDTPHLIKEMLKDYTDFVARHK
ncbi:MAG TPA: aldo/keto reductase [Clostridiales bacterium]|nr:aldo/keto reductase [Clostridiales bacterium]